MAQPNIREDEKLIDEISRRLDMLSKKNKSLNSKDTQNHLRVNEQHKEMKTLIDSLKEQSQELTHTMKGLHKEVFSIGHRLKNKVTKKEFDEFKQRIDKWNPEEFVTKQELQGMYKRYAD